jgi:hypothetical protein
MSTINSSSYTINGVIDTNQTVMDNINILATASSCWVTLDINSGKWSVVINRAGSSVAAFNNSNILGPINVSGTGLTELYNSVEVSFPHKDLYDQKDFVRFEIPQNQRFENEPDNTLNMQLECVNDPVQAGLIASRELKQSRVDKIINFSTDYTQIGLKAGDIITVTAEPYGFSNKLFRVITIAETDGPGGEIVLEITALEYDANVYNTSGLIRTARATDANIIPKGLNTTLRNNDNEASLKLDLSGVAKALGLSLAFNALTGRWELDQGSPIVELNVTHAIIGWTYQDGEDLDIRCRVYSPNLGQLTLDDYLGYTGGNGQQYPPESTLVWPPSPDTPVLVWGGDNTGVGGNAGSFETVYVNVLRLKELYPSEQYFIIECRGNWYTQRGLRPVQLSAAVYQGGSVTTSGFGFVVSNFTNGREVSGLQVYVNSFFGEAGGNPGATALGDLMGYFIVDATNNTAQFVNNLNAFQ